MTRRGFLTAAAALPVVGFTEALADMDVSTLGTWMDDDAGLPCYRFTAALPLVTHDRSGEPFAIPEDPFFLLGNHRLSLFTHVSGLYRMMTGERSWGVANAATPSQESNGASLEVDGRTYKLTGKDSLSLRPEITHRVFGTGYATWTYALERDLTATRTISVPPSDEVGRGDPVAVVVLTLENRGRRPRKVRFSEWILGNYEIVAEHFTPPAQRVIRFGNTVETTERYVLCRISGSSGDPTAVRPRTEAARYDAWPPALVLAARRETTAKVSLSNDAVETGNRLGAAFEATVPSGATRQFVLSVGLAPEGSAERAVLLTGSLPDGMGRCFRDDWRRQLPDLRTEAEPVFRREIVWDAYVLEAMATYSEFYGETFVPQGTTYEYELDLTAAPRDFLQYSLALSYGHPKLAKSAIRYVLCGMLPEGQIRYTHRGYGLTSNAAWIPSDQQLYLFQAVGEYLRVTGDYAFLNEATRYLPIEANFKGTTLEKLTRAFFYLRDEVGTGPHGLIKLRNSDWNDMIYTEEPVLRYFETAESHMNTAMAMAVFPELIRQLESARPVVNDRTSLDQLSAALRTYLESVQQAMMADLGTRTYSRRLYFSADKPFGHDNLHLEPQIFLLQSEAFPRARKAALWREIQERALAEEVLGPRQREKPLEHALYPAGMAENGGFWYSLAGQLIVGLATLDVEEARRLLRRMTFDNYSRHFPAYWHGAWSSPDTLCSRPTGRFEGLPRPTDHGLWLHFPTYCAHVHAWKLYGYYRLKDYRGSAGAVA